MTANTTTSPEQWTIRRVLDWTKDYLTKQGSPSPRLDAEILLAHAKGCPRIQLYTHFDDVLGEDVRSRMRELVKRRANLEPVAYLVGYREFFSLDFEVNQHVLIPRPETESLVMETLEAIRDLELPRVLDLGTGSGCIAIAVAVNCSAVSLTAVDISEAALEVASRNAKTHAVADRIDFVQCDLFGGLQSANPFDVIVSNPPYIATNDPDSVQTDVSRHEPHTALYAGPDGLDLIRRIANAAPPFLKSGGTMLIEFSPEQADAITQLLATNDSYSNVTILRDTSQQPRVVRAIKATGGAMPEMEISKS